MTRDEKAREILEVFANKIFFAKSMSEGRRLKVQLIGDVLSQLNTNYKSRRLSVEEIYHLMLKGKLSWYDTAKAIFKAQEEKDK